MSKQPSPAPPPPTAHPLPSRGPVSKPARSPSLGAAPSHLAHRYEVLGLCRGQAQHSDEALSLGHRQECHGRGVGCADKQRRRHLVDLDVGALEIGKLIICLVSGGRMHPFNPHTRTTPKVGVGARNRFPGTAGAHGRCAVRASNPNVWRHASLILQHLDLLPAPPSPPNLAPPPSAPQPPSTHLCRQHDRRQQLEGRGVIQWDRGVGKEALQLG